MGHFFYPIPWEYANDSHGYHIPMDKSVDQTY